MRGISCEDAEALLAARIGDAVEKCRRGRVAVLPYLTPREQKQAERALSRYREAAGSFFFGGYPQAERACLFLLPDYLLALLDTAPSSCESAQVLSLLGEDADEVLSAVRITGSGYRVLTHRDYLGAILNLGLRRESLGDLAVQNEHSAVLFCPRQIVRFLCESLSKVASDTVRCQPYEPDEHFTDGRRYEPVNDTVASARLDCVVAALTNLSREDAQSCVRTGLVEVDFEPTERVELILEPPVWISVRGYGRYRLNAFDGETKKGRLRLRADRLI